MSKRTVEKIAYHRNGSSGNGFHVVTFTEGQGEDKSRKVGLVFSEPGNVAVLDIDLLANGNITPGENSWRVEDYEEALREAVIWWQMKTNGWDRPSIEQDAAESRHNHLKHVLLYDPDLELLRHELKAEWSQK